MTLRPLLVATAALALTGCLGGLLPDPQPAPSVYRLVVPERADEKATGAFVVRVDNPSSPRTFNTRDVLVVTSEGNLSSAGGAQWSDTIPQLLQDATLTVLGKSPRYVSIIPVSGARADIRIHLDIRDFSAVYDQGDLNAPLARTHVYATVADAASRNFIGSYDARGEARATENRVSSIVNAQSAATREALEEIVRWMNTLELEPTVNATTGRPSDRTP